MGRPKFSEEQITFALRQHADGTPVADVCRQLRRRLDDEIQVLDDRALRPPAVPLGTDAATLLGRLDEDGVAEEIRGFAVFSEGDQARLSELNARLGEEDPARRAGEVEARAQRFRRMADSLEAWHEALSDAHLEELGGLLAVRQAAREAARIASEEAFHDEPLSTVGTDPWRVFWEAARRFAEETGGADHGFPPEEGDPCLLCQTRLDSIAANRMQRFEAFVRGALAGQVEKAELAVEQAIDAWRTLPRLSLDDLRAELMLENGDRVRAVEAEIAALHDRRGHAQSASTECEIEGAPQLRESDLIAGLRDVFKELVSRAAELRRTLEEEGREELARERDQLEGRRRLAERREELLEEVNRRRVRELLRAASRDTNTRGITRKNTELTRGAVSDVLGERFLAELRALRLDHVPIQVAGFEGERGTAYHRVRLDAGRHPGIEPGRILSQGEHRCVALAAFIAELATQEAVSTVVFDDPVSSLDHDRREHVARRLVELGATRPVLVFTHDIVFLAKLQQWADEEGVELTARRLTQDGERVGRVRDDWPWRGLSVARRVRALRDKHQRVAALHGAGRIDEYESLMKEIYGDLREAWERGVEEELLNGALVRFGPEVQTQRLRRISSITDAHIETLDAGMSRCSRWFRGHDDPTAVDDPMPGPEEIEADIEQLNEWRQDLHRLHQAR